ncbi:MAG: hypothetical protein H2050_04115 [Sphingobium sp.]|jgi:TolA-binding protein|uniref:hypothetical protein n=1 Tax=Sphingobium sp. TaxID=1912891 RepID=UPI000C647675|nr:hypothetical protein [Sphingobium sp.]MBA4754002.1 hypothetical protein [Sphingobium sp.]MBS89190.1 hypothetical protein [Sphingobium sp.]MBU0657489.1 hypothetical protein [Alphaproteobacteria bacterium]MBU1793980.1 hypothetical protein [Alphaproteobacteria bacterium]
MRHAFFATSCLAWSAPLLLAIAPPAIAQNAPVEVRVDRLEKEMKAVQRKVFPAGAPVEAQIVRPAAPTVVPGSPSSSPISDLTARVGALESQLASITGQVEENSFKLKQLEEAFTKYKAEIEGRLLQPETPPEVRPTAAAPVAADPAPVAAKPAAPKAAPAPAPAPATPAASEARKAAIAAIERPDTGDAAMDSYSYGFRLWDAKFYPEAQAQLKATVDKYGDASVASRAQNLLGRAYLDDGKPALASVAFYENYQKRPRGDRAADSLAYLGEALIQLKKPADACKVYAELEQVYGTSLSASLRGMMDKGRTKAKCS